MLIRAFSFNCFKIKKKTFTEGDKTDKIKFKARKSVLSDLTYNVRAETLLYTVCILWGSWKAIFVPSSEAFFIDLFFNNKICSLSSHWVFTLIFALQGKFYFSFLLLVSSVIRSGH